MKKQTMYIIGGVAVLGLVYFFYSKNKKAKQEKANAEKIAAEMEAQTEIEAQALAQAELDAQALEQAEAETEAKIEAASCIRMGELRTTENHQWIGIPGSFRDQANQFVTGGMVEIKDTDDTLNGKYEILDIFKDKKGNVGAIDIAHSIQLPTAVKGQAGDKRFQGTGKICVA